MGTRLLEVAGRASKPARADQGRSWTTVLPKQSDSPERNYQHKVTVPGASPERGVARRPRS
jgi:hypothetical protein